MHQEQWAALNVEEKLEQLRCEQIVHQAMLLVMMRALESLGFTFDSGGEPDEAP